MNPESRDIVQFQQGDVKAFEEVYHQFYPQVMFFARKMTRSAEIGEDIAMDSFRKLWTRRANFENISNIKAFLMITTRNACLDYLKYQRRSEVVRQELKNLEEQRQEDEKKDFVLLTENVVKLLHEEINNLPPQCKIILKLRLEGYNNREIGKLMSISIFTVRNQMSIALKKLRINLLNAEQLVLITLIIRAFL